MTTTLLAIVAAVVLAGVVYQAMGTARDLRNIAGPGRVVRVNGRRVYVWESGSGTLTVIFESGITASSVSWARVLPEVAKHARVIAYDRFGLGWSDRIRSPRTPQQVAAELDDVLAAIGSQPPYILVGHSFGGLVVRAFTARHPGQVVGMVLVDALHPAEWLHPDAGQRRMLRGGVFFSRVGAVLGALGVVRFMLARLAGGARRGPKAVMSAFGKDATRVVERVLGEVVKLPPELHPAIRAAWSRPKSFLTMASYIGNLPRSSQEVQSLAPLPAIPLIVLSAENPKESRAAEQRDLANLCSGAEHIVVSCGHWVHLDKPEVVIEAILRVIKKAAL